jgi:hypothetical protein
MSKRRNKGDKDLFRHQQASEIPKPCSGKIRRIRADGSVDFSLEDSPGSNEWNLHFDLERNVSILKRTDSGKNETQVQTNLDSCLYVLACGIKLVETADPSLLQAGSCITFHLISTEPTKNGGSTEPALSAITPLSLDGSMEPSTKNGGSTEPALSAITPLSLDGSMEPVMSVLKLLSDKDLDVQKSIARFSPGTAAPDEVKFV